MEFLNYLDDYEKKLSQKIKVVENKELFEKNNEKIIVKKKPVVVKRVIKKTTVESNGVLNKASSILDESGDVGVFNMMPLNTRFYNNDVAPKNINIKDKKITSLANDLLGEDANLQLDVRPLTEIPKIDDTVLMMVPPEMLDRHEAERVRLLAVQNRQIQENSQKEIPQEIQQMMAQTQQLQAMLNSVDMSGIPLEFLPQ